VCIIIVVEDVLKITEWIVSNIPVLVVLPVWFATEILKSVVKSMNVLKDSVWDVVMCKLLPVLIAIFANLILHGINLDKGWKEAVGDIIKNGSYGFLIGVSAIWAYPWVKIYLKKITFQKLEESNGNSV